MASINHGTRGGYYAHKRLSQPPCQECRDAINEYVREYRARTGNRQNREREWIRRRALSILRERHRDEYEEIKKTLEVEEHLL